MGKRRRTVIHCFSLQTKTKTSLLITIRESLVVRGQIIGPSTPTLPQFSLEFSFAFFFSNASLYTI
jgi:hypothetical protein